MNILKPDDLGAYLQAAEKHNVLPMFYLELVSGLRKGELVALRWDDLDITHKSISVSRQLVHNPNGEVALSGPKTKTSVRLVSNIDLLIQERAKHSSNLYMFPSPTTGEMYHYSCHPPDAG